MKQNVRPLDSVREIVAVARLECVRPNHAPTVAHHIMGKMWSDLDDEAIKILAGDGLSNLVRKILKGFGSDEADDAPARAIQLDLFAEHLRPYVEKVDRARVYVPSRDEHVDLTPDAISVPEMREAGHFLIAKGEDCIRRGNALLRLADASEASC